MSTIKTVCPCCEEVLETIHTIAGKGTAIRYIVCQTCESDGKDTLVIMTGEAIIEAFDNPSTAWTDETLIDSLGALVRAFKTVLSHSDMLWTPFTDEGDDG